MRDSTVDTSCSTKHEIARAKKTERERLWLIENADAMAAANAYIEKYGLPFAKYRQF